MKNGKTSKAAKAVAGPNYKPRLVTFVGSVSADKLRRDAKAAADLIDLAKAGKMPKFIGRRSLNSEALYVACHATPRRKAKDEKDTAFFARVVLAYLNADIELKVRRDAGDDARD